MSTQSPNSGGQPPPTAPGKPSSRQPPESNTGVQQGPDEGQELPKTGRDSSDPIEEDTADDDSADDDDVGEDDDDADEDDLASIELPGEGDDSNGLDGSKPVRNS